MVEAALISPVFVLLLLSVLEFGFFFKDDLAVGNAAHDAAREASAAGRDGAADYAILSVARRSLSALERETLDYVVVYRGDPDLGRDSRVPDSCTTWASLTAGGVNGTCNVYTRQQLESLGWIDDPQTAADEWSNAGATRSRFGCIDSAPSPSLLDCHWPGLSRKDAKLAERGNGPPDFVGVYVKATHDHLIGLLRDETTVTDWSVVQIEPRRQR